jgi:hypothetical protein
MKPIITMVMMLPERIIPFLSKAARKCMDESNGDDGASEKLWLGD